MDTNNGQQHVLILGDGSSFDKGVTQLLTFGTHFQVSHAIFTDDLSFLNMIKTENQPGVLVINEAGLLYMAHILNRLSSHPLARAMPIVVVRHYKNEIDILGSPIFVMGKMVFWPRRSVALTEWALIDSVRRHLKDPAHIGNFVRALLPLRFPPVLDMVRRYFGTGFAENFRGSQDSAPLHANIMKENTYEDM